VIECVFTIDYEIYGNGTGSLKELIYDPTEKLIQLFRKWDVRFVPFVEVAELDVIGKTDETVRAIEQQIRELHRDGFELGLHLHPQWYNARYTEGNWELDHDEYNLCMLSKERIESIITRALEYLRRVVGEPDFVPVSFRAGNWLFQPTKAIAEVLSNRGIRVDSSVFKGGFQRKRQLDYRRALKNGFYWRFGSDVNVPDARGSMVEIPIHSEMVPFWKMFTMKRVVLQNKAAASLQIPNQKLGRWRDFVRLRYPLKFDFCRMTLPELRSMTDRLIRRDKSDPATCRPFVAIGHTKDLVDLETVERFLEYLHANKIRVSTFAQLLPRLGLGLEKERGAWARGGVQTPV